MTLTGAPSGKTTLTWGPLSGYALPIPRTTSATLERGGRIQFLEVYLPQAEGAAHTQAQILRYLLGLPADVSNADLVHDGVINSADLVRSVGLKAPAQAAPRALLAGLAEGLRKIFTFLTPTPHR